MRVVVVMCVQLHSKGGQQLSSHVVEVMALLSDAVRTEADPRKRELYRQAVEATSQVGRATDQQAEGGGAAALTSCCMLVWCAPPPAGEPRCAELRGGRDGRQLLDAGPEQGGRQAVPARGAGLGRLQGALQLAAAAVRTKPGLVATGSGGWVDGGTVTTAAVPEGSSLCHMMRRQTEGRGPRKAWRPCPWVDDDAYCLMDPQLLDGWRETGGGHSTAAPPACLC